MMYLCLSSCTVEEKIPVELLSKYEYTVPITRPPSTVEYGRKTIHPTWKNLIERYEFGEVKYSIDKSLIIIRIDLSLLNGEIDSVKNIGANLSYPNNTILNEKEYQELLLNPLFFEGN